MEKYELTDETIQFNNRTLYRIKALKNFNNINKGDLGGFVESKDNLSQNDNCWIYNNAKVYGDAEIYGYANVYGYAEVYGDANVYGDAEVYGNTKINSQNIIECKINNEFDDVLSIKAFDGRIVTGFLINNKIYYSVGCQVCITEETFRKRIVETNGGLEENPHRKYYYKIIDIIKTYFNKKG